MKIFSYNQRQAFTSRQGDQLFETLQKLVRQRELNYNSCVRVPLDKMEAISRLKRLLDFYRFSRHEDLCHGILKHEADIRSLIPYSGSRYYTNAKSKVDGMLNYAKAYLNQ
jgi:hypothetical protein